MYNFHAAIWVKNSVEISHLLWKNCVRKELTFSYTVLFLDIYKYFTISQGTPHYPISNRVHTVAYFLLLFFFLHLCPVILGIRKYKLYRKGRSQVIRSVSFCLRLAKWDRLISQKIFALMKQRGMTQKKILNRPKYRKVR